MQRGYDVQIVETHNISGNKTWMIDYYDSSKAISSTGGNPFTAHRAQITTHPYFLFCFFFYCFHACFSLVLSLLRRVRKEVLLGPRRV